MTQPSQKTLEELEKENKLKPSKFKTKKKEEEEEEENIKNEEEEEEKKNNITEKELEEIKGIIQNHEEPISLPIISKNPNEETIYKFKEKEEENNVNNEEEEKKSDKSKSSIISKKRKKIIKENNINEDLFNKISNTLSGALDNIHNKIIKRNSFSINLNTKKNLSPEKKLNKEKRQKYKYVKKIYSERNNLIKKKKKLNEKIQLLKFELNNSSENDKKLIKEEIQEIKKKINKIDDEIEGINIQIKYSIEDENERYNLFTIKKYNQNIDEKLIFESKIKKWIKQNKKYEKKRQKRIKEIELEDKLFLENEIKEKEEKEKLKAEKQNNFKIEQQNLKKKLHLVASSKLVKNDLPKLPIPKEKEYFYSQSESKYIKKEKNLIIKALETRRNRLKSFEKISIKDFSLKIDKIIKENIKKNIEKSKELHKIWKENKDNLPKSKILFKGPWLILNNNNKENNIISKSTVAKFRKDYGNNVLLNKKPKIDENLKEEMINNLKSNNTIDYIKSQESNYKKKMKNKIINVDNSNLNWKLKLYDDDFFINYQKYQKLKRERLKNLFLIHNKMSNQNTGRNNNNNNKETINTSSLTERNYMKSCKKINKRKNSDIEDLYIRNEIINNQIKQREEIIKVVPFNRNQKTMNELGQLMIDSVYNNLLILDK